MDLPGIKSPNTKTKPNERPLRLVSLESLDKRTNAAKAAYALRDAIVADCGGAAELSALKVELVNTVAVQTAVLNDAHARILSGDASVSLSDLSSLTNTRNRTATMVGLGKASKTLDLDEYVSATYGAKQ